MENTELKNTLTKIERKNNPYWLGWIVGLRWQRIQSVNLDDETYPVWTEYLANLNNREQSSPPPKWMEPQGLGDNNKRANIHFLRVPEGEERERMGIKKYLNSWVKPPNFGSLLFINIYYSKLTSLVSQWFAHKGWRSVECFHQASLPLRQTSCPQALIPRRTRGGSPWAFHFPQYWDL